MASNIYWANGNFNRFLNFGEGYGVNGFVMGMLATGWAAAFSPLAGFQVINPAIKSGPMWSPTWFGTCGAASYFNESYSGNIDFGFVFSTTGTTNTFIDYMQMASATLPLWWLSQPTTSGLFALNANLSTAYGFSIANGQFTSAITGLPSSGATITLAAPSNTTGIIYGTHNSGASATVFQITPQSLSAVTSGQANWLTGGFDYATCSCPSGTSLVVGGSFPSMFASGANAAAVSPASPNVIAAFASTGGSGVTGTIQAWLASAASNTWTQIGATTGYTFSSGVAPAWTSISGLVTFDAANNKLVSYSYGNGAFAAQTTLTNLTGASSFISVYQNASAVVSQPATSGLMIFTSTDNITWAYNSTLTGSTIINPAQMAYYQNFLAVCVSGGLYIAAWATNGALVPHGVFSLGYTPTTVCSNGLGQFFTAAASGANLVDPVSGSICSITGIASVNPVGSYYFNGQYFAFLPVTGYLGLAYYPWNNTLNVLASGQIRSTTQTTICGISGSLWNTNSGAPNLSSLLWSNNTFLLTSASGIYMYEISYPFSITPVYGGAYSIMTSAFSFSALTGIGPNAVPGAMGLDYSGAVRVVCNNGYTFTINTGGAMTGTQTVWASGGGVVGLASGVSGMYGATSLTNAIINW